jgi:hypothetical protein
MKILYYRNHFNGCRHSFFPVYFLWSILVPQDPGYYPVTTSRTRAGGRGVAGVPKCSFTTLLSPPQCHAAFGTMPYTLASVDKSPVCRHSKLPTSATRTPALDFGVATRDNTHSCLKRDSNPLSQCANRKSPLPGRRGHHGHGKYFVREINRQLWSLLWFKFTVCFGGSWDSSVSIVSDYRLNDRDSILGTGKLLFHPDSVLRPTTPNLLSNGYRGPFPDGKTRPGHNADYSYHLVPR